ncbi:hypothetical protein UREOM_4170 [Ureaplasma sp. OM1]|uniref:Uncharacterized protein n=2 Tax=Ureaplasma ceti TaxID=3119530 RepID=A0ABP9U9A4_9BACT
MNKPNKHVKKAQQAFSTYIKSVIGLSSISIIFGIVIAVFLGLAIWSSVNLSNAETTYVYATNVTNGVSHWNDIYGPQTTKTEVEDFIHRLSRQTDNFWIIVVVLGVINFGLKISNAIFASRANTWLLKHNHLNHDGKVIFICSIVAVFIFPIILQAVALGFASALLVKSGGEEWSDDFGPIKFNIRPRGKHGHYPYYPQNHHWFDKISHSRSTKRPKSDVQTNDTETQKN